MLFKRKLYQKMLAWQAHSKGRSALLIQGARRVGKSTLVRNFAESEYQSYILIDFAQATPEILELFEDLLHLDFFFLRLQAIYKVKLHPRDSVIIFDEVQLCPKARQAIKYLVADGRYDYIETGSLLSIRQNIAGILIPSEEHRLDMYPLDFEEFLWAIGDTITPDMLAAMWAAQKPAGNAAHREMMRLFRLYMLIGGMPQAIVTYLTTNNFAEVDTTKREILSLYAEDFHRIDPTGRASQLFISVPAQLTSNAARFQTKKALPKVQRSRTEELIANMANSYTILLAYHANNPDVGMALTKNMDYYKIFLLDTGLLVTLIYQDREAADNELYRKLLSNKMHTDLGYIYENVVAQMTVAKGDALYYYTFPSDTSNHNYEIDFLLTRKQKICPLEVKSSGYKTHASLDAFYKKYSHRIGQRYLIYTKDLTKEQDILCVPIYLYPYI